MAGERHYYIEAFDTVEFSSFRQHQSPFAHRYATESTIFGLYCGRLYPLKASHDEDPIPNYWKLRRGVLLYDVPEQPIEIVGPDAVRVLEQVLVCKVETLGVGRCRYALACYEDGTIVMDGVIMRLEADRFWYVKANGEFISWLKAAAIGLDAEVSDPDSRVLQIQGPKSLDVLNAAIGGGLPADFKYFRAGFFNIGGQTLWVSRTGWTGEVGIEIYCNSGPEPTDHDALWDHLLTSGEQFGMEFSTSSSMGIRRIEAGILDNGSDIEPDLTPVQHRPRALCQLRQGRLHWASRVGCRRPQSALARAGLPDRDAGDLYDRALRERSGRAHNHRHLVTHPGRGSGLRAFRSAAARGRVERAKGFSCRDHDGELHEATVELLPFIDKREATATSPVEPVSAGTRRGTPLRLGIHLPQYGRAASPEAIAQIATRAEEIGLADVWVSDHLVFPADQGYPASYLFDPLLTLGMGPQRLLSESDLGTSVMVVPQYHPLHLANSLASLDQLSGGRLTVGAGVGWSGAEFSALGQDFHTRGGAHGRGVGDHALGNGTESPASYEGKHYQFEDIKVLPQPAHPIPHLGRRQQPAGI